MQISDDFCGTWPWPKPYPWKWWLLGQLDLVRKLLETAAVLSRSTVPDTDEIRGLVKAAHTALSLMEDQARDCEVQAALAEGRVAVEEVLRVMDDGTAAGGNVTAALKISIKIIIKIGRVTISIEF